VSAWEAGRDLDGFIAEHLRGYRVETVGKDAHGEHGGTEILVPPTLGSDWYRHLPNLGPVHRAFWAPEWSTQWRPFPDLLAWMAEHGSCLSLTIDEESRQWECSWITGGTRYTGFAQDLRLAVCRALAKAGGAQRARRAQEGAPPP
jgi:hypothetical protein